MIKKINDLNINYIQYGKGKDIVLLHGWGQNIEMMQFLGDRLCDNHRITILDLPGFGNSEEPHSDWFVKDYVNLVHELVKELKIKKPIIIGHSFGGRVAIKYSSLYDVEKVVLFGAPCIRRNTELDFKTKFLKKLKTLPGMDKIGEYMKQYIGSRDYKAASPVMRQTLVNTVNENLEEDAKKIEVPTLLIWGTNDTEAPIEEARELEKIMKDAALIELPGTHYAYIENLDRVIAILNNFI
ncbi:MAG: alpha/beta hydrolase [Bacilli bacterium]|nr:alpha/beta hydrolase [Bacilli bacterium]